MNKKNKCAIFFIVIIIVSVYSFLFILYTKTDSLNNIVFKDFDVNSIDEIELRSPQLSKERIYIKDDTEKAQFISHLDSIKVRKLLFYIPTKKEKRDYYIVYYTEEYDGPYIRILGEKYIAVSKADGKKPKVYEILDNSLDDAYLNELLEK